MRLISITCWLPDMSIAYHDGMTTRPATTSVDHGRRYVTDGGTNRSEHLPETSHNALRQSAASSLFAVDADNRLTAITNSLSELAVTEAATLSGQHLSSLLSVPEGDFSAHLETVRRRLREGQTETVRSTACLLRTPDGRRSVTVEFSTHPEADPDAELSAKRLVGVVRENVVEIGESQPQPSETGPDRFRALFEQLPDPVAEVRFVESEPIVTSVNPAFEETFGLGHAELVGEPLNEYIVPEDADDDTKLDREAANGEWTSAEVIREAADGPRLFLFRSIPFRHDGEQHSFGVYTDVTDRESQQRYHEVLNRLLRHNLRNDLNVILGLADQLATEINATDTDTTAVGDRLKQRVLDLIETTRRARELESVIDRSETDSSPTAIDDLVAAVHEELTETYPNATIRYTVDEPAVVIAGPALREAVVELAENAVEHTAVDPTIHFRVTTRPDETVVITIADDGPGIPAEEWAVVDGAQSITPLDHCSGLGLWLAKWIVEAYGGDLAFVGPDPELGGAAIELRLRQPSAETAASDRSDREHDT
jgi:PAS domain S-box-containing protein